MAIKDYSLLAAQPASVAGSEGQTRDDIVISAVVNDSGQSFVISRYGDMIWELWPFFEQANVQPSRKRVNWANIPAQFRQSCKAVLYRYWMVGIPGFVRPIGSTIVRVAASMQGLSRYLDKRGLTGFGQVQPLHLTNFLHEQEPVSYTHLRAHET